MHDQWHSNVGVKERGRLDLARAWQLVVVLTAVVVEAPPLLLAPRLQPRRLLHHQVDGGVGHDPARAKQQAEVGCHHAHRRHPRQRKEADGAPLQGRTGVQGSG